MSPLFHLLFALLLLASSALSACDFPNGTATALHWWQCGGQPDIVFTEAHAVDEHGKEVYPIHMTSPIFVQSHMRNIVGVLTAPNLKESIRVFQYTSSWSSTDCQWSEVPTFGLLKNLDACSIGVECPVAKGEVDLKVTIDFTKFSFIISHLTNDIPYMIEFTLTDKVSGGTVCISAQARGLTK